MLATPDNGKTARTLATYFSASRRSCLAQWHVGMMAESASAYLCVWIHVCFGVSVMDISYECVRVSGII